MTPCISGIIRKTGHSGKNVTYTRDISCKMKANLAHNKNIVAKTFQSYSLLAARKTDVMNTNVALQT